MRCFAKVIQWDNEAEESSGKNANQYMEILVKETMTLHKVLNKYLPQQDLRNIMSEVFQSFTSQLTQEVGKLSIQTQTGKNRQV